MTILGSGSAGNATYVETPGARILIDAGFSARQIRQRLAAIGRTPETLNGILITHEHSDHIQGLTQLAAKLHIPVFCNRLTREAIEWQLDIRFESRVFETGSSFEIGDLGIETFTIPHDASDPVGFTVHAGGCKIGYVTDLGHATKLVVERIRASNILVLESNHDVKMLQEDTKRPWHLKQRILGKHGHLSNETAADIVSQILSADLKHLYLGHLSRECNKPELALRVMTRRMEEMGAHHVNVALTHQDVACPTLEVNSVPVASGA